MSVPVDTWCRHVRTGVAQSCVPAWSRASHSNSRSRSVNTANSPQARSFAEHCTCMHVHVKRYPCPRWHMSSPTIHIIDVPVGSELQDDRQLSQSRSSGFCGSRETMLGEHTCETGIRILFSSRRRCVVQPHPSGSIPVLSRRMNCQAPPFWSQS